MSGLEIYTYVWFALLYLHLLWLLLFFLNLISNILYLLLVCNIILTSVMDTSAFVKLHFKHVIPRGGAIVLKNSWEFEILKIEYVMYN